MVATLEIGEPLASRLQAQAAARQISPTEFACAVLDDALQHIEDAEVWKVQNQRRIALIRKSAVAALTAVEHTELQALQDTADRRLEARDQELLAQLDRFKRAVEQLSAVTETA